MTPLNPNVTEERVSLKPCPFCACDAELRPHRANEAWVTCTNCGASTDVALRSQAIAAWNTRTPDPELLAARRTIEGAAGDVIAERQRQVEAEGWTPEHDDEHSEGQMAAAAVCYAFTAVRSPHYIGHIWPWSSDWFKPTSKRRNLVKASALILAEIERLDRAALSNSGEQVK